MRKLRAACFFGLSLAILGHGVATAGAQAQNEDATYKQNQQQARAALDAMVKALGGDAWLNMQNRLVEGRTAGFYRGNPTGGISDYFEYHIFPGKDRIEFGKKRDVVQIYDGESGWEVTYRGKSELPKEQQEEYLRRRSHSIETAVKIWLKDPATVLLYEGQKMVERHLAEQVTLISASNDSITIEMDHQTHLPLARSFEFRNPIYKDKDTDTEEYDDYHVVDGFPTPFALTRFRNGEMVSQRFLYRASYNLQLPPDLFNVDATVAKIKK